MPNEFSTHDDGVSAMETLNQQLIGGVIDRRDFIRKSLLLGVSVSAIGTLLAACSSGTEGGVTSTAPGASTTAATAAPSGPTGTLTFGNAEPPTANYWDPAAGFGLVDEQVASLVHDTLLAVGADGSLGPSIAVAWSRTDATTMAVEIRSDVKFHDGTPLTAQDVKASFERLSSPDTELAQAITVTPGLTVNVLSDTELEIVTPEPYGVLEAAMGYVKILRSADIAAPDNFKNGAMGSGPYRFGSYTENAVTLTANSDYWGGAPNVETVVFQYIEDAQARMNALLDGQVDIMTRVSSDQLATVEGNAGFSVTDTSPPAQIVGLVQHNGPFADVKLRQALAYAVDRQSIADNIMEGVNPVGFSSIPTNAPFYEPLEPKFAFDPEKAKALIAEAGAEGLTISMSTSTLVPHQPDIDQAIAQFLESVGVTVDIERLEVGAFRSSYNTFDISLNTLASFTGDPDFILGLYTGGAGAAIWHLEDPAIPPLLDASRTAIGEERQGAVTDLAQYLWGNQMTLYLSDEVWWSIVSSRVSGYRRAPVVGEVLVPRASVA